MPNFWWTKYNDFLQVCWFLAINLAFYDPPSLKFHNRNDIELIKKLNAIWEKLWPHCVLLTSEVGLAVLSPLLGAHSSPHGMHSS